MSSGGYSGGFGQQPSFGGFGGFGQSPQYGGYGVPQQPQFGGFGGFGGGFGMPQPQYGGFQQPQYGGFQQPQYGGGFGLMPPPRPSGVSDQSTGEITFGRVPPPFDGGFGQRGPGNAYARPFPQLAPQPMPFRQPIANPSTGVMPSEPLPDPNVIRSAVMPPIAEEPQFPVTGGGYPSRDTTFYSQVIQPTMIEPTPAQQNTSYAPSAEKQRVDEIMKRSYTNPSSVTAEDTAVLRRWEEGANARNAQDMQAQMQAFRQQQQLAGGLGGTYGGYQAMPYGGYQPMGGYRMFQF